MLSLVMLFAAAQLRTPADLRPDDLIQCLGTSRVAASMAALGEARASAGEMAWSLACAEARAAEAQRRRLVGDLLTGHRTTAEYESTSNLVRLARSATDPALIALFRHVAHDQAARESFSAPAQALYAPGISPLGSTLLRGLISVDAIQTDAENQRWLAEIVQRRGWFLLTRDGEDADRSAWLIVQHSDANRAFQHQMITLLEPLAARGETSPRRFASLYDRWATGAGAPQRYGSNGTCAGEGQWRPGPVEDPERLDARRAAAGLPAFAQHIAEWSRRCATPKAQP